MATIQQGINSYLNGNSVMSYSLTSRKTMRGIDVLGRVSTVRAPGDYTTLSASLVFDPCNDMDYFNKRVIGLGAGKSCDYCGVYCPPVLSHCDRCNAPLGKERMITPFEFPFVCAHNSMHGSPGGLVILELSFYTTDSIDTDTLGFLQGCHFDLHTIPHTVALALDYYLCQWCGMATKKGEACFGCGGGQLPMSEIINIDRACLYCGNDSAFNGVICHQCGARLRGEQVKEYIGVQLWQQ